MTDGGGSSSDGGSSSGASSSSGAGSSSGASSSGSSGGVPEAAPPHLGARGDVCQSTPDCGPGLQCIVNTAGGTCAVASDCAGKVYTAFAGFPAGTCRAAGATGATDCACQNGGCYLMCQQDLDCAVGYTCDATSHLCKLAGACTTDAQCAQSTRNALAKCASGTCTRPCTVDRDCGTTGSSTTGFSGNVCVSGTCATLGCSTDTDCNVTGAGTTVHMFCVAPPPAPAVTEVSAITN